MQDPQPVVTEPCLLGEGPIWVADAQALYWTDIKGRRLHAYFPDSGQHQSWEAPFRVGSIVPTRSGGFIGACDSGFFEVDSDFAHFRIIGEPEPDRPDNRFNDGKCDPAGRFWAGTMDFNGAADRGALYCLDVDHSVSEKIEPVTISNGLVWTADSKIMYYIDTAANTVRAYDYEVDTGAISGERVVVTNEGEGGFDGMSIDEEGMLWVAVFGGWGVRRYNPGNGELLRDLRLPMSNVTSCAFGGDQLDELYVTSAAHGMDESALREQPLAGSLVKIDPGVRGVAAFSYAG